MQNDSGYASGTNEFDQDPADRLPLERNEDPNSERRLGHEQKKTKAARRDQPMKKTRTRTKKTKAARRDQPMKKTRPTPFAFATKVSRAFSHPSARPCVCVFCIFCVLVRACVSPQKLKRNLQFVLCREFNWNPPPRPSTDRSLPLQNSLERFGRHVFALIFLRIMSIIFNSPELPIKKSHPMKTPNLNIFHVTLFRSVF